MHESSTTGPIDAGESIQPSESAGIAGARPSRAPGTLDLLATCTFGLEAVVVRELEQLGYVAKPVATGRVHFLGDLRAIAEANIHLRAADRVLIRVGQFPVGGGDPGFDQLFDGVKALEWERFIAREAGMPVAGRSVRSLITSVPALQRATKRAIVDRLREVYGRPGVPSAPGLLPETGPRVAIEVALANNIATLTIDTSGVGLHKRGYRAGSHVVGSANAAALASDADDQGIFGGSIVSGASGEAGLKETLAAGLVLLSVWRPGRPLVDPFCGSGTIAIEAALIARGIAPGLNRSFDAERWLAPDGRGKPLIDASLWREVRDEAKTAINPNPVRPTIHASDLSDLAIRVARANARGAGVERDIHFTARDFADLTSKLEAGCIVTNPPYGVRLGEDWELERLYRSMPAIFAKMPSWSFHILSGRLDLEQLFGQQATRRRKLYNSTIECGYFTFLGPKPVKRGGRVEALSEVFVESGEIEEEVEREGREEREEHEEGEAGSEQGAERVKLDSVSDPIAEASAVSDALPSDSSSSPSRSSRSNSASPAPAFGGLRERDIKEAGDFARCLTNNLRHLRRYPGRGVHAFRVYERDVPDVPLIVDRYDDRFHVAEYEREHSRTRAQQHEWVQLMRRTIAEVGETALSNVYFKEKHRQRGLSQHEKFAEARDTIVVQEGTPALRFEVNLSDYVDTGLFLDHRLTRQMVREQSSGKRVLNLFCYTGSFSVYAAAGGALSTTSVDLSNTYLLWAERNFRLNNIVTESFRSNQPRASDHRPQHRFIKADVLEFLDGSTGADNASDRYDLAIVDPPTFSNSKSTRQDWEVSGQHADLLAALAPRMAPEGVVYFSTNYRRFKLDLQRVAEAGMLPIEISKRTVPPEYRNKRIHRCWRLVNVGPDRALEALASRIEAAQDTRRDEHESDASEFDDGPNVREAEQREPEPE